MKKFTTFLVAVLWIIIGAKSSFAQSTYFLVDGGDLTSLGDWGTNTDGSGSHPSAFTNSLDVWHLTTDGGNNTITGIEISAFSFLAHANSTLVVESGITFSISAGAQIDCKISVNNGGTLYVQNNSGVPLVSLAILQPSSTVVYGTAGAATKTVVAADYGNLLIETNAILSPTTISTTNIRVFNVLTLQSSVTLSLSGRNLSLFGSNGTIAGSGVLAGDSDAAITIQNGNATSNGTLTFASGAELLNQLSINYGSNTDVIALGSNLTVGSSTNSPAFNLSRGILDIRGVSLTTNSLTTLTFPTLLARGSVMGNNSTTLSIGFSTVTRTLNIHPTNNSFALFELNAAAKTFTVRGGTLNASTLAVTAGTLSLNNVISATNVSVTSANAAMVLDNAGSNVIANATINDGNMTLTNGPLACNNVTVAGATGGVLTVNNGTATNSFTAVTLTSGSMVLSGGLTDLYDFVDIGTGATFNAGSNLLTLKSNNTRTARIGQIQGTYTGNDITIETFIPGNFTGWANLGVHGVSGQNVKSWDTYSASAGTTGLPMTCNGCDYDENSLGSYFVSIQDWTEATGTYGEMTSTDLLTPGKGFWTYVGNGFSNTSDLLLINTGPAVTGQVTVALTSAGTIPDKGFNLVANPYPSPVSWASVLSASGGTTTGLSDAIYVWNADLSSGSGALSSYIAGVSSPSSGAITDVIPAGQGFYVETSSATTLVFDESVKSTANTNTNPILRPAASAIGKVFRLNIAGTSGDWDGMAFRIHDDATDLFDKRLDAKKIFQSPGYLGYPGPYTHYTTISGKDAQNEDYSIQSIPALTQSVSIPVLARGMATGNYTISATEFEDIDACIVLKDKLTGTTQDLKTASYIFTLNDTTSTPRFELILCKEGDVQTSVPETLAAAANSQVLIQQDGQGAFVKTNFEKPTKATISVCNIIGQKLMEDIVTTGTTNTTYLPLNCANQVVFVTVTTDSGRNTKKIVVH